MIKVAEMIRLTAIKWTHIVQLIGVVLCIGQLIMITIAFLDFDVITKVTIETPTKVSLPSLTICDNIVPFFDAATLHQYGFKANDQIGETTKVEFFSSSEGMAAFMEFLTSFTVGDLLKMISHRRSQLSVITVTDSITGWPVKGPKDQFERRLFMISFMLCQMISPKNRSKYEYRTTMLRQALVPDVMATYLVEQRGVSLVTLTPAGKMPWDSPVSFKMLEGMSKSRHYDMTYKMMETQRLRAPYKTKCVDYQKEFGTESNLHHFQRCMNDLASKYWNSTAPGTTIECELYRNQYYERMRLLPDFNETMIRLTQVCLEKIKSEPCDEVHYLISGLVSLEGTGNHSVIYLRTPNEPTIKTTSEKKLTTLDYLISFGSTLGYWLGFSVVSGVIGFIHKVKSVQDALAKRLKSKRLVKRRPRPKFELFDSEWQNPFNYYV